LTDQLVVALVQVVLVVAMCLLVPTVFLFFIGRQTNRLLAGMKRLEEKLDEIAKQLGRG